ncbi:MAG: hypothetical protein AB1592_11400 [Pseudomonadota bacterium]
MNVAVFADTGKSNAKAKSTVGTIEAARVVAGLTVKALCGAATVDVSTYWRILGGQSAPQRRTIVKLTRALDRLAGTVPPAPPPAVVAATWRAAVLCLCHAIGAEPALALDASGHSSPEDKAWMRAARARQLAFYLVHVELGVGFAELAAAVGSSKQRVHKAVRKVEDLRDDPEIDALIERTAAAITGRQS